MAKRRKKNSTAARPNSSIGRWQPSYWMIVASIFFFFSAGLVAKIVFAPGSGPGIGAANFQSIASGNKVIASQVKLVAANFRCACGGCGELFLVDCTCDMPRGAVEEKNFIRDRLQKGATVDQVINLVDQEYGHKIS